jgi:predicted GNAT family acetyltransferase
MDILHVFTPPEARGKGLAEKIVRHVLKHCNDKGLKVLIEL